MERNQSMVGRLGVGGMGGLCGPAYYPKTFLGDTLYHPDLFLCDFGRFSGLFCLISATINAIYQEVC